MIISASIVILSSCKLKSPASYYSNKKCSTTAKMCQKRHIGSLIEDMHEPDFWSSWATWSICEWVRCAPVQMCNWAKMKLCSSGNCNCVKIKLRKDENVRGSGVKIASVQIGHFQARQDCAKSICETCMCSRSNCSKAMISGKIV